MKETNRLKKNCKNKNFLILKYSINQSINQSINKSISKKTVTCNTNKLNNSDNGSTKQEPRVVQDFIFFGNFSKVVGAV